MKNCLVLFIAVSLLFSACRVEKPYYQTLEGKKKQKYYNDIQFGANKHPKMKF